MTAITPLEFIHKKGLFGDHQKKNESDLLRISEVTNSTIIQLVQHKTSKININDIKIEDVIKKYGGSEFSNFKIQLSENLINVISPIGNEMNKLLKDQKYLDSVISEGVESASKIARPIIDEVYQSIGLLKT